MTHTTSGPPVVIPGNLGIIFTGDTQYPPCESGGENAECCECIRQRKSTKRLDRRVTGHTVYNDISAFPRVWIMVAKKAQIM